MKATYWISIVVVGTAILGGGYGWATRSTHYRTPDYTQLEALLATQQWDAADQETTRLMRDIAFDATLIGCRQFSKQANPGWKWDE